VAIPKRIIGNRILLLMKLLRSLTKKLKTMINSVNP
jgi:hypothetical protein